MFSIEKLEKPSEERGKTRTLKSWRICNAKEALRESESRAEFMAQATIAF